MIRIVYRISDVGYHKVKPAYINNETCLRNAIKAFPLDRCNWYVVADSVCDETKAMIESYIPSLNIDHVKIKNGPGYPFMHALDKVLGLAAEKDIVYFLENDYLHKPNSDKILKEGFKLGADYATLYDCPDKYVNADRGGNPFIEDGGEITRVLLTESCHWKLTNSTTGTFASTVKILKQDYDIIKKYANNRSWSDFNMFLELRDKGRTLVSSIPGYATHGEVAWLAPLTDWESISNTY